PARANSVPSFPPINPEPRIPTRILPPPLLGYRPWAMQCGKPLRRGPVSSEPIRAPIGAHLLTPQNSALVIIDYQPTQVNSIKSMDHQTLIDNVVTAAKTARAYG